MFNCFKKDKDREVNFDSLRIFQVLHTTLILNFNLITTYHQFSTNLKFRS